MKIYYNPRCGKSRETLKLIQDHGIEPEIILYLEQTQTSSELRNLLSLLNLRPEQLIRKSERIFEEMFKGKELADDQWIEAMVTYPKLIERPIVVAHGKAIIGRPPERVLELIKEGE